MSYNEIKNGKPPNGVHFFFCIYSGERVPVILSELPFIRNDTLNHLEKITGPYNTNRAYIKHTHTHPSTTDVQTRTYIHTLT